MKVVILAGGLGTRFAEETEIKPKPMIEIGHYPILWHIMKIYAHYGYKEFFVATGYKGEYIKRFFLDYQALKGNLSIDFANGQVNISNPGNEDWNVNLIDTGPNSMTGGRIKRLTEFLQDEPFMVTYGDGVSDVNIEKVVEFHRSHGKLGTVTAVHPPARYGEMVIQNDLVTHFAEKPQTYEVWINGGFLVFEPEVLNYLSGDESILEIDVLERLAKENELVAYKHYGFWQCMDTLHDKRNLENAWHSGNPPWKVW